VYYLCENRYNKVNTCTLPRLAILYGYPCVFMDLEPRKRHQISDVIEYKMLLNNITTTLEKLLVPPRKDYTIEKL
jgi:hypothetical protein